MNRRTSLSVAALLLLPLDASARPLPDDPFERRCWLQFTADRAAVNLFADSTPVTFSNLRDGFHVRSPLWVEFGIRGMGVMPAGNKREQTGHHHLLIDTPLPASVTEPIPFSDKHRHFGKGQTAVALDLSPGPHHLRLLFADHEHRPYYVFSRKINIMVTGSRKDLPKPKIDPARFAETCQAWYQDEVTTPPAAEKLVYAKNLRNGETVGSPFLLKLGVVGLGVAAERTAIADTGFFQIDVRQNRSVLRSLRLSDGQTETVLDLEPGDYDLDLAFLAGNGQPLLRDQLQVTVTKRQTMARP